MKYLEYSEQCAFFKWARNPAVLKKYPALELIHCSHNTQKLTMIQAARWKAAGGVKGYPDVFLPFPARGFYGLYLEFKSPELKPKTSRGMGGVSPVQAVFFNKLRSHGYKVEVVYSWGDARKIIEEYLE